MHPGSIDRDTAAGRVYRYLRARPGLWVDAWALTVGARVTAVSTRKSEVKAQLIARGGHERVEHERRGNGHYYRLVEGGEQMVLGAGEIRA